MNTTAAIHAYENVGLTTEVMSADPHRLTALLFEGALLAIARAQTEIANKDALAKGQMISKAIAIIGEGLNASLNKEVGGQLARDLSALYDYMVGRLVTANINSDTAILQEVAGLLAELKSAWDSIRPQVVSTVGSRLPESGLPRAYARA